MPELPEVETVRDGLMKHVLGARIVEAQVLCDRSVRPQPGGAAEFADRLVGHTITAVVRRGKFLWLPLSAVASPAETSAALIAHLGMSGQLLVRDEATEHRHLRARLQLADTPSEAKYLDFVDQRIFGYLAVVDLVPTPDGLPGGLGFAAPTLPAVAAHIARDLLDPALAAGTPGRRRVVDAIRRRRVAIKTALLNQELVSGIGNIYADEALWRAGLHYAQPVGTLTETQVENLLAAAENVMCEALAAGGTSFDALYVNATGEPGYFERSLAAYGREGAPCPRCATPIRREPFQNRSSFFCPKCQNTPAVESPLR
ncbi:MAG: bifunctional DNA-formamidopyrimidine glycosylase/DNA-(apurinic or apyrimidinic site) lyase [Promicromonosporaceae bacterium]|nr:bifunctional DNA-formamidopyrimidine glycosylase/DNA-(apurinic or apyrimidinic site) lyase [Promicromonosporaceae bacterium]